MASDNPSTLDKVLNAGELAISLLRRVNAGEITADAALNQAEIQWNEAATKRRSFADSDILAKVSDLCFYYSFFRTRVRLT